MSRSQAIIWFQRGMLWTPNSLGILQDPTGKPSMFSLMEVSGRAVELLIVGRSILTALLCASHVSSLSLDVPVHNDAKMTLRPE